MKPWFSAIIFIVLPYFIWSTNAQVPFNWVIDEVNPGEDVTILADEAVFTEGFRSCHLQLNSGAVPYLISEVYYITPGADYEFSIDIFDNDTAGQVKVYADFYDTYGFDIFGEPPVFSVDSGDWQTITWQGKVPSQAVVGYVLIKFYCQPNLYSFTRAAHAWIDNVRFIQNGGANLVLNGGFEQWMVGIAPEEDNTDSYVVYPNPTDGKFVVRGSRFAGGQVKITLLGLSGNLVESLYEGRMNFTELDFDIGHLPDGMYFLSIHQASKYPATRKIILSRK